MSHVHKNFFGHCPTEPEQSGTFGNFKCQMAQEMLDNR